MRVTATGIAEVLVIEPKMFGYPRGFFFESFNQRPCNQFTGLNLRFVQDNHSRSAWNDPYIEWPGTIVPQLSVKDQAQSLLQSAKVF